MHLLGPSIGIRIGGIEEDGNQPDFGYEFAQQFQPFRDEFSEEQTDPGDIPARPVETGDETFLNRITTHGEDNGNCRRRCPGRGDRRNRTCEYHSDLAANQVVRKRREPSVLSLRPAVFDLYGLADHESSFPEALMESGHVIFPFDGRSPVQKSDHWHRLLRPRREWPSSRRTTEQRDELAPGAHSITSSARARSDGGTSRPSALAVLRLMISSNLVGACTGRSAGFSPLRMRST